MFKSGKTQSAFALLTSNSTVSSNYWNDFGKNEEAALSANISQRAI